MNDTTAWDRRLSVEPTAKNLIGHTGAVLLRRLADRTSLTHALPTGGGNRWRDRTSVLTEAAIALGTRNLSHTDVDVVLARFGQAFQQFGSTPDTAGRFRAHHGQDAF